MNALKADYQVEQLAQTLEVSLSGFYRHQEKGEGARAREDRELESKIKPIFHPKPSHLWQSAYSGRFESAGTALWQKSNGPAHAGKRPAGTPKTAFCPTDHSKRS